MSHDRQESTWFYAVPSRGHVMSQCRVPSRCHVTSVMPIMSRQHHDITVFMRWRHSEPFKMPTMSREHRGIINVTLQLRPHATATEVLRAGPINVADLTAPCPTKAGCLTDDHLPDVLPADVGRLLVDQREADAPLDPLVERVCPPTRSIVAVVHHGWGVPATPSNSRVRNWPWLPRQ